MAAAQRASRLSLRGARTRARQLATALVQPQVSSAARERRDLLVLLAAVALVVVPHFDHLAWWATAILVLLWLWRVWLTVTQRPAPGRFAMLPLLVAAASAVWIEHGTLVGRDAGVTFLLLLMALKLLELRARRDVFVVIFLAFFILLTQFLFSQSLPIAALTIVAVALLFFVLTSVNLVEADLPAARKAKLVGAIVLKAIPLAVAAFVLFPRISGPLWGLPGDATASSTGLSNAMSPGSISRLLESNAIAFRARFESGPPGNERLYWRGPVFGHFNGRTWTPLAQRTAAAPRLAIRADPASAVDYSVTLEPHQRDWLFALEVPAVAPDAAELAPALTPEAQLVSARPITERVRYAARSYTAFALGTNETDASLRDWLQLPPGYNPRALQFAAELRRRLAGGASGAPQDGTDAIAYVNAVLEHFRTGGYRYTLDPPLLGRHSVDEFLFDTRSGYCEHYAAAFVVLMRTLGVPARVVTGYQGGEINPVDGFMTVRQSDAHAWTEVWLRDRGWTRVDPTAVVAPVRIARGLPELQRQTGLAPLAAGDGALGWLRSLRFNWEALQNRWNQWVLSYTPERQRALLAAIGLDPDGRTLALAFAVTLSLLLGALAVFSLRHRVERDPLAEAYALLRRRLSDAGIDSAPTLAPRSLFARVERQLAPASRDAAREILLAFERCRYSRAAASVTRAQLRALRREVRRFRPRAAG
ncbi:MAG: transglutaminaseTgpA domain-containing protein [Burkholderiaceae bacterium]